MRAAVRLRSMKTKVTHNVRMELEGPCSLSSLPLSHLHFCSCTHSLHCRSPSPSSCQVQHGLCVHLGLGLAATDQVTHQQEIPTHCAKTETAEGEDIGSSDFLPKQDPGSRLGGGIPGGAHWNQKGPVWGQKRAQTDGWSSSDHRV